MLEAMTTSRGSMCTIHARTAASVTDRIIQLALSYGPSMTPDLAQRTAANGLDLIVYVNLADETGIGGRKHRLRGEHRGGHRNGAGRPDRAYDGVRSGSRRSWRLLGTYPSASAMISRGSVMTSASWDRGSMRDTVRGGHGSTRYEAADEPRPDRLHRRRVWIGGAVALIVGMVGTTSPPVPRARATTPSAGSGTVPDGPPPRGASHRLILIAGAVAGILAYLVTKLPIAGILVAAAVPGAPWLFTVGKEERDRIDQIEAIGEWRGA